jgi:CxxC motif-containing protein (DUF1111 family)
MTPSRLAPAALALALALVFAPTTCTAGPKDGPPPTSIDPGVRGGKAGAGSPLVGLDADEVNLWKAARVRFQEIETVPMGLGPRFNGEGCVQCHSQPNIGGTSPATNPQIAAANDLGATNTIPSFITLTGPIREARFKSDGGVHDLFTIAGRSDAPGCPTGAIAQPDFSQTSNISFRIPTPLFGVGLVENVPDQNLMNDAAALASLRSSLGIGGKFNHKPNTDQAFNSSGNTGTIMRFGWKAQNASLLLFAGEAANVEMGVTNELFTVERAANCNLNPLPEDVTNINGISPPSPSPTSDFASDIVNFGIFMRLNEPPTPIPDTPQIVQGRSVFSAIGCNGCHIPQHTTTTSVFTGQSNRTITPYSDFQLHDMGNNLADGIVQGDASGSQFRTAPLWGAGQRIFFLHDGRATNLVDAIEAHDPGPGNSQHSEAHQVIANFNNLSVSDQTALVVFLRGL